MPLTKRWRSESSYSESTNLLEQPPSKLPRTSEADLSGAEGVVSANQENMSSIIMFDPLSIGQQDSQGCGAQFPRERSQRGPHGPAQSGRGAVNIAGSVLTAGGNINFSVNDHSSTLHQLKIDLKPVAAAYNSSTSSAHRRVACFEGTRVKLLGEIEHWIKGRGPNQPSIYVLDGVAGVGKSTIAQTIAERAATDGILGASFFISRDENERNTGRHFFSTLAYQLACRSPELADLILQAVKQDPDIEQKDAHVQFECLILHPLLKRRPTPRLPTLVVIDALDECDQGDATSILQLLGQHTTNIPSLLFFITSRPEFHITDILDHLHGSTTHWRERFHLHDIETSIVQSDIRLYLDHCLSVEQVRRAFPYLSPPWQPTADEKQKLYGICGTLFIIASTATKFILNNRDTRRHPAKQCACLLEGVSSTDYSGSKRMNVLDRTYIQILRSASGECSSVDDGSEEDRWTAQYQTILGPIIFLQNPLPSHSLAELLDVKEEEIEGTLLHLHSLVAPGGHDRVFRVHHKSFPEFITSRDRIQKALEGVDSSGGEIEIQISKFHLDPDMHHRNMARRCFQVMQRNLKRNMCDLSSADWTRDRDELVEHTFRKPPISAHVSYACVHWASHLCAPTSGLDPDLKERLCCWASEHVLSWLETLGTIDQIDASHSILENANSAVSQEGPLTVCQSIGTHGIARGQLPRLSSVTTQGEGEKTEHKLETVLNDCAWFIRMNVALLRISPMHVYCSGIMFTPVETSMYALYNRAANVVLVSGAEKKWSLAWAVLAGHSNSVTTIAFSPNGSRLASGSFDNTVQLWDARSGSHLFTLRGHSRGVRCIAFSPDGLRLALGSEDSTILLWDAMSGTHLSILKGHSSGVTCVAFSQDGSRLASGSLDKTVRLWDANFGSHLTTLEGHTDDVNFNAFSPDGLQQASGSDDKTVRFWDAKSGSYLFALNGHSGWVGCIAFSPDGLRLASGSFDNTIQLWDAKSGSHISTLKGHGWGVRCVAFSPDGSQLASGSFDYTVRLWDGNSGSHLSTLQGHSGGITCIGFLPGGALLASGSDDKTIRLWYAKSGTHLSTLEGHRSVVRCIAFSPDGSRLASGSEDNTIRLWNVKSDSYLSTLDKHRSRITCICLSPDGLTLASGSGGKTVQLWDSKSGSKLCTLEGHIASVQCIAFSPDGLSLASGSDDKTVQLWDSKSGSKLCNLEGHIASVKCIAFSADGCQLASGSDDKTIRLWDAKSGFHLSTIHGHTDRIRCIAFSPDGSQLASGSNDKTVRLWDAKSGSELAFVLSDSETDSETFFLETIAFSPAGVQLALGMAAAVTHPRLWLWNPGIGARRAILEDHNSDTVRSVFFISHSVASPPTATDAPARVSRLILLVKRRKHPHFYGLAVSADIHAVDQGPIRVIPICWFPLEVEPNRLAVASNGSSLATVACENGRFFVLDFSSVPLP